MDLIINSEICKPIPGFSRYHISISGRLYRTVPLNNYEKRLREEKGVVYFNEVKSKLYCHFDSRFKYLSCGIRQDNKPKPSATTIVYLVTLAFNLMPIEDLSYYKVIYKDGNPGNCHVDNIDFQKRQPKNNVLKKKDIPEIRKLIKEGEKLSVIARTFGVCEMQVQRIKTGAYRSKHRKIKPKKLPFKVEDPRIRRLLTYFQETKLGSSEIKSPFIIKRDDNDSTNNVIVGRINGYRFKKGHANISRAREIVDKLNRYFFSDTIADKYKEKFRVGMKKNIEDLAHRASVSQ